MDEDDVLRRIEELEDSLHELQVFAEQAVRRLERAADEASHLSDLRWLDLEAQIHRVDGRPRP